MAKVAIKHLTCGGVALWAHPDHRVYQLLTSPRVDTQGAVRPRRRVLVECRSCGVQAPITKMRIDTPVVEEEDA